jgi:hypothetical protein
MTHSDRAHATLAPSAAHRWMACPGSVRLSAGIEETPSSFAAEGTAAHMLAERCMRTGFDANRFKGWAVNTQPKQKTEPIQQGWKVDGKTIFAVDAEMVDSVQVYLDLVRAIGAEADDYAIETRMDMSTVVPGVFGTGDFIAYREQPARRVTICDFKYGKGVAVDARDNEQLLTYAVGVVQRYHNRGVDEVELIVVQPRAPHRDGPVRRWVTDSVGLYEHVMALQSAAIAAEQPDAPFNPGDACKFCKAAGTCSALYQKVKDITMTDPTVTPYRDWKSEEQDINLVKTWAKRREEFAHSEAIRGRMPPGAKLVGKRAIRKWKDENEAVSTLQLLGVSDDLIFETSLRSPAQVEKELPKGERKGLDALTVKASSGTVLAPLDDPRAAVDPNDAAGFDVQEL